MRKVNHAYHQTDLPIDIQILNISVNMARMGKWIEGGDITRSKMDLIQKLISQTHSYLNDLSSKNVSDRFKPTLKKFKNELRNFKPVAVSGESYLYWSERALTWADILQIRAKLS